VARARAVRVMFFMVFSLVVFGCAKLGCFLNCYMQPTSEWIA